ncbi:WD40 repeat domain-containing protein [Aliinostoc sp. HNIBRCY26]|uniref:WD40 repeat domain-containing protein n=1 Tax=Aliinostoc sp. HNIBRCY26 TaxID=3418997 RepID=UPI003D002A4D
MGHLRSHRCLIILDNVESILASGDHSGRYQTGYADYGDLFKQIGATGKLLTTFPVHLGMSVAFSPDSTKLAFGNFDNSVNIWDITTKQCYRTITGHNNWVWWVAFSPDGQTFATGSAVEKTIKLWDIQIGECLHTLQEHQDMLWAIAFSPDGKILASTSSDNTIKLWDIASGK